MFWLKVFGVFLLSVKSTRHKVFNRVHGWVQFNVSIWVKKFCSIHVTAHFVWGCMRERGIKTGFVYHQHIIICNHGLYISDQYSHIIVVYNHCIWFLIFPDISSLFFKLLAEIIIILLGRICISVKYSFFDTFFFIHHYQAISALATTCAKNY